MGEAHARLGPSNHRWPHCPGSVREEANYMDIPGPAAIDGTGSHLLLEMCMEHEVRAEMYVGRIIGVGHHDSPNGWLVTQERADRVQMCLDYIERRRNELEQKGYNVKVFSEEKTDPGGLYGRKDWWGTCDVTIVAFDRDSVCRFVEICDYKDGRGYVSVKDKGSDSHNTQLVSYGVGQVRNYIGSGPDLVNPLKTEQMTEGVRLSIVQPKTTPPIRYEDLKVEKLIDEGDILGRAAFATDKEDAPLRNGKWCKWCKHKDNCNEESNKSLEVLTVMTDQQNPIIQMIGNNAVVDVKQMTEQQLFELADSEAGIMAIFDSVKTEIEGRLKFGKNVPGYKMLPGNSKNVWNCEDDEVAKKLKGFRLKKDDIYPPKLISPAQALKLNSLSDKQKDKIQKELISSVAGNLKLTKVAVKEEKTKVDFFADVPSTEPAPTEQNFNFF